MNTVLWPGWLAGSLIGLYALAQYWLSDRQLGCSLAYGNFSRAIPGSSYFRSGEFASANNWRLWFILGIPLGSLFAHVTSGAALEFDLTMGSMYERVLPDTPMGKAPLLIAGGVMMGYGARLAGGCTSGHVIAGVALLSPVSLLAAALFFVAGLGTVQLLFALAA